MSKRSRSAALSATSVVESSALLQPGLTSEAGFNDDLNFNKRLKSNVDEQQHPPQTNQEQKAPEYQSAQKHNHSYHNTAQQFNAAKLPSAIDVLPDDVKEAIEGVLQLRQGLDLVNPHRLPSLDGGASAHTPIPTPPPVNGTLITSSEASAKTVGPPSVTTRTSKRIESRRAGTPPTHNNRHLYSLSAYEYDHAPPESHQSSISYQDTPVTVESPNRHLEFFQSHIIANQPKPGEPELAPPTFVEVMLALTAQENLWPDDETPFIELASARIFNDKRGFLERLDPPIEPRQLSIWRAALKRNIMKHLPYVLELQPGEELAVMSHDCLQTKSHIHGTGSKKFQSDILARALEAAYWDGGRDSYATRLHWYSYPVPAVALVITLLHFCLLKPADKEFMPSHSSGQSLYNVTASELNEYIISNPKKFKSTIDVLWDMAEKNQGRQVPFHNVTDRVQETITGTLDEEKNKKIVVKSGSLTKGARAVRRAEQAAKRAEKKAAAAIAAAQAQAAALASGVLPTMVGAEA
ncbi:hypothetical protein SeMB42_g01015 [Synchytrium endobioticum]|uniref:DUF6532 domain-containing protein n=1 Tax=Synchytrium endobioticum TaxID=286115 RepID=A0A507DNA0_9FUNG|nr:hypothetical protein SeMB42_g01015 [Synchytrium endobioticum]